jgi:RNA polymerase sigma factor (sigma-70 family)
MSNGSSLKIEELLSHRAWVRGIARALVFGDQDAEDLEQQAWLMALESPPGDRTVLRGWLSTVTRRLAWRTRRREVMRRQREVASFAQATAPATADVVARAEMQERVVRTVLRLQDPYRETVLLRFFEELSLPDVAKRMSVPLETVRSRLRRGLALLRTQLEEEDAVGWRLALLPIAGATTANAGTAAVVGTVVMTKIKVASVLVLVAALSWLGWTALKGPRSPEPEEALTTSGEASGLSDAGGTPGRSTSGLTTDPAVTIRPRPFSERDEEISASSRAAPGVAPATAGGKVAVVGEVLAPDGSPVEDASVFAGDAEVQGMLRDEDNMRLSLPHLLSWDPVPNRFLRTKSGSNGTFSFDHISAVPRFTVAAYHPEFGLSATFGIPIREGEQRRVTLRYESGVRFFGSVTNQDALPVALAKVRLTGFRESGQAQSFPFVQSDPSGGYRTETISGTQFHLSATAEGYYGAYARMRDLPAGTREHRVDLMLERAPHLRGRLVAPDGSPARVAEHLTDLFGKTGPTSAQRPALLVSFDDPRKDPNFRSLGRGEGRLLAEQDAYELTPESKGIKHLSLWLGGDLIGLAQFVAPDVAPDIVVDWSKASRPKARGSFEVRVRSGEDDAPVTKYSVRIQGPLDGPPLEQSDSGQVVEAVDGRFTFNEVLIGRYQLTVKASGFDDGLATHEVRPTPELSQVTVVLVPTSQSAATASITGVVKNRLGERVNGATVWIVPDRSERSGDIRRAETDAEGAFRVDRLLPDSYLVIATPGRGTRLAPAWARVAAPAAERLVLTLTEGVEVRFILEGTSGPLSFRVVDEAGVAVIDDSRNRSQRFGASPTFVLAAGKYEVHATCPGFIPARAQFVATEGASVTLSLVREPK